jgi:chemosensory pili system protein ChpB (putative protein-glutamate methylesterase)
MSEAATAVALLFDDAELGGHLRDALRERGAKIVHEGTLATISRDVLQGSGAEVVVINLDDEAVDGLDHLYDVIDSDRPRIVFNDAQASRGLDGWDRARWARHLAAKVMSSIDLDPPRPVDAPAFVPQQPASEEPEAAAAPAPVEEVVDTTPVEIAPAEAETIEAQGFDETVIDVADDLPVIDDAPLEFISDGDDIPEESIEASESLAAELEALLAADEQHVADDEFGSGLNYAAGDDVALHDGDFAVASPLDEPTFESVEIEQQPTQAPEAPAVARPAFQLDHLSLAPLDENFAPVAAIKAATSAPEFGQSSAWSLVDEDAPVEQAAALPSPSEFGIEKLSAADYLAPDASDDNEHDLEPGLSLELVSMEEAIAPQQREDHEVMLGELDSVIARVLLLGASADSTDAVCQFLHALPKGLRLTVLHTQHHAFDAADTLADRLKNHTSMPIRVAGRDSRTRMGEILFVPAGQQVRLLRDGRIESHVVDGAAPQQPSIDASFTTAAGVFGRDAIAIVFAGNATDAVAGAQAVYDRGGQVWVESAPGDHYAGMVRGIEAERLVSFSGTPQELAARLTEQFA